MPFNKSSEWRQRTACALPVLLALVAGCSSTPPAQRPVVPAPATTAPAPLVSEPSPAPTPVAAESKVVVPSSAALVASPAVAPPPVARPVKVRPAPDLLAQQMFDGALQALKAGKVAEAEQTLSTIARTHPELGGASANLGLIHRQAGRLPQALEAFDKAIAANPDQAAYHAQRGLTLREMGRFEDAKAAYEKALQVNPDYALAALNLGVLLDLYMGDAPGAMAQFQRYLALTPSGDPAVTKWVAELKNRKTEAAPAPKEPS
jgi:tetratricopeptide (TPR) repeat protein